MGDKADRERIEAFMRALGDAASADTQVYLTGGACAVLLGWRSRAIDIDLKFVPLQDELLLRCANLKAQLNVNLDLANPTNFIPELPDWESRSSFIASVCRSCSPLISVKPGRRPWLAARV